jgi:hypothetical protein
MRSIYAMNVREAYKIGLERLVVYGVDESSRVGPVKVMPGPVCTIYEKPTERVLLNAVRDANPFFHFFEGIWMLSGSKNGAYLNQFVSDFTSRFADDGTKLHGAYGYRWRNHFNVDQLRAIVGELKGNPQSRRCVLSMWDPDADLGINLKDIPCNTHVYFRVIGGYMDMMVNCRSNDMIWGGYGANAVHFSMLQEYIAAAIGVEVGQMYQNSWNFHAYCDILEKVKPYLSDDTWIGPYEGTIPLVSEPTSFLGDCEAWIGSTFFSGDRVVMSENKVFTQVALPMQMAHGAYRKKKFGSALTICEDIEAPDWRRACTEWIQRRADRWNSRRDAGELSYERA